MEEAVRVASVATSNVFVRHRYVVFCNKPPDLSQPQTGLSALNYNNFYRTVLPFLIRKELPVPIPEGLAKTGVTGQGEIQQMARLVGGGVVAEGVVKKDGEVDAPHDFWCRGFVAFKGRVERVGLAVVLENKGTVPGNLASLSLLL
ncbi:hypothetical protein ED733_004380 [Metarhizium rileyi]|uniref:Uncharacterized protein n=1 Tax=Metarhizium rileyi (strain RCEF 4871) TaxID=1649241 RepID=A0A5C6GE43_METRR|nr:hypothetical protein ED733_004380 [Metarhizium rileyi]